ncbi:MAG: hypothetical protein P4L84_17265 [Isosphaeraceae bacterium]|nr:hypothetical protein [Isosphaeraceae bacterium]
MIRFAKRWMLAALFARWRRPCPFEEGYTILLPSPMDMPFLLRYALEGLARLDTTHCRQVLVVPDGWGDDRGAALARVVEACGDPRVEMVPLRPIDYFVIRRTRPPGGADTHWLQVVNGTTFARCAHAFLHDADAFFLEADGLERQYRECRERGMSTLGVTPRWDPHFTAEGLTIPGTWELMYSTRWARSRAPSALKGGMRPTPDGVREFDSMLHAQYLDYASGRVGVMDGPPRFVHFNGTIFTYRAFRDRAGRTVADDLFRILLLALLEDLIPDDRGGRVVPQVEELARGLGDPDSPVSYCSESAARAYPKFRAMVAEMCDAPIFAGERSARIGRSLIPFDDHFQEALVTARAGLDDEDQEVRMRRHGLG